MDGRRQLRCVAISNLANTKIQRAIVKRVKHKINRLVQNLTGSESCQCTGPVKVRKLIRSDLGFPLKRGVPFDVVNGMYRMI